MIGVEEARRIARKKLAAKLSTWATQATASPILAVALKPPTERDVRADELAAETWVREWSAADLPDGMDLEWETRSWRSLGRQRVPVRLGFHDAYSVASFVGGAVARDWTTLRSRVEILRDVLGASDALDTAVRRHAAEILAWQPERFAQVVQGAVWLSTNSIRGLRPRQIPIRGVDTKWFKAHRSILTALHHARTGSRDLGIVEADRLIRIRILDSALAPACPFDFAASPTQLEALPLNPDVVFIFENLETVLAMPEWPGAVVLHGDGYAVDAVGDMPWVRRADVVYWGDLDSHGFAILHRLRTHLPAATSVLMDVETLLEHRDLWVSESTPTRAQLSLLPPEHLALQRLRDEGDVRLEQERIPWARALAQLRDVGRRS